MLPDNKFTIDLSKAGWDFTFTYYPDMTWSSFGAPAYCSMYITSMDLYTGKTGFLWPNGQIRATGSSWTGGAYSASTANHAFKADATAPLENWRIVELWYGQKLSKELEVRIGSYQYAFSASSFGAMNPAFPTGHVVLLNTRINF